MTKKVRIEDADGATHYKVVVEVWNRNPDGPKDNLVSSTELFGPTDLRDFYIHDSQYIVIREKSSP